ncbi:MAG: conserved repeat domain protein [Polaromonas sp.]|nr:conserved repeat domain protein [Polaromonas sp.]
MTYTHQALSKNSSAPAKGFLRFALVLGAGLFLGGSVMAQPTIAASKTAAPAGAKAVFVELTQFKVVKDAKGAEQLVAAPSVMPGDVIEYKVTYKNTSAKPVDGLVADLPIPEGLEYLPKSAKPGAALVKAAAKDGQYAAEPLMRKLPDNKSEPVPYNEYRALRWNLGQLPAGAESAVTARAKVETVVPPAPKTAPASGPSSAVTVKPASAAR